MLLGFFPGAHASTQSYRSGCVVFQPGKILKTFPGSNCLFLPDGSFISASNTHLKRITTTGEVDWEIPGAFHHQMNLALDGESLFVMSSEVEKKVRSDKIQRVSLTGKILSETTSKDLIRQANLKTNLFADSATEDFQQISHFNSISEIPSLEGKGPPYLSRGNIIINSLRLGFFILSPDLKNILHHQTISTSRDHSVHDVQVTKRGTILFFNNEMGGDSFRRSGIQELFPASGKIVSVVDPGPYFYSPVAGSVQEIDDDKIIFCHAYSGTYIYSRAQKKLIETIPGSVGNRLNFKPVFEVKIFNEKR